MQTLRPKTVKLLSRLIKPWVDEGIILVSEQQIINSNLKHIADKGTLAPAVTSKLIDQREAAEMLGLGHSNFKKLEKEDAFPFKRKMVGSAVRYRNIDIINYILKND
jgi:predicted DNA-binding transcriptional regulator AlpA